MILFFNCLHLLLVVIYCVSVSVSVSSCLKIITGQHGLVQHHLCQTDSGQIGDIEAFMAVGVPGGPSVWIFFSPKRVIVSVVKHGEVVP